jgi:transcriptional regulator with XRE-family HTH domain
MALRDEIRLRRLPPPPVARAIRIASNITQQTLADEIHVHRVTLARWELGTRRPRGYARQRYAEALSFLEREVRAE